MKIFRDHGEFYSASETENEADSVSETDSYTSYESDDDEIYHNKTVIVHSNPNPSKNESVSSKIPAKVASEITSPLPQQSQTSYDNLQQKRTSSSDQPSTNDKSKVSE